MPFSCEKCGRELKTLKTLERHMNRKIPCDKIYKCPKCNKEFKLKKRYTEHLKRKTPCKPIQGNPTEEIDDPKRTCNYCYKKFTQFSSLKRHYKTCKVKNGGMRMLFGTIMKEQKREINKLKKKIAGMEKNQKNQVIPVAVNNINNNINNTINNTVNNTINLNVNILGYNSSESHDKIRNHFRGHALRIMDGPLDENAGNLQIINKIDAMIKNSYRNNEIPETQNIFVEKKEDKNVVFKYINLKWIIDDWNYKILGILLQDTKQMIQWGYITDKDDIEEKLMKVLNKMSISHLNGNSFSEEEKVILLNKIANTLQPTQLIKHNVKN